MTLALPEIRAAAQSALSALDALQSLRPTAPRQGLAAAAIRQLEEALANVVASVHRLEITDASLLDPASPA